MKFVFVSNRERMKRNTARLVRGIFLSAVMVFHILLLGGMTVCASDLDGAPAAGAGLDFRGPGSDQGDLDTDGYHWDAAGKKLSLKNAHIGESVLLPDDTVTIESAGECFISELSAGGDPQNAQLIFTGSGRLTIEKELRIYGGDSNIITVAKGACVVADDGIGIGASGGVNSTVTVYGTLTAKGSYNAISAGRVVVGAGGLLQVSGEKGIMLNGMNIGGNGYDVTGVFTVERGGCFIGNCTEYHVKAVGIGDSFPPGTTEEGAFSIPEGYLPSDCQVKIRGGEIDFVKKSTGEIYTGALTIHENHVWPEGWNGRDEVGHWKECTVEGCGKTTGYEVHTYDDNTGACACGSTLTVLLSNAEGLVYDGQEKKPGVAAALDGAKLDASRYQVSYGDNINAGEASVILTGKGDLGFKRTVKFQIAKAVPVITWGSTAQTVTYSGSQVTVSRPVVTLAGGESFKGEIAYSYAAKGSTEYTPGLPKDAGTYTIRARIAEQNNYTAAESTNTLTLTIEQAEQEESTQSTPSTSGRPPGSGNPSEKREEESGEKLPASKVIPKLPKEDHEHEYIATAVQEASCMEEGVKEYTCSCGDSYTESIPALDHSYESEVTKEPTVSEEGVMTYTCSLCGDTYTEPIEKLEEPASLPDDRQESSQAGWPWWLIVILLVILGGIGGVVAVKRKKGEEEESAS